MIVSNDKTIVIFTPTKTGSTSLRSELCANSTKAKEKGGKAFFKMPPHHRYKITPDLDIDMKQIKHSFVIVRNPWEVLISQFHFHQISRRQKYVTKLIVDVPYTVAGFEIFCERWAAKRWLQIERFAEGKEIYDAWVLTCFDNWLHMSELPSRKFFRLEDSGTDGLLSTIKAIDPVTYAGVKLGRHQNRTKGERGKQAGQLPVLRDQFDFHYTAKARDAIGNIFASDCRAFSYPTEPDSIGSI